MMNIIDNTGKLVKLKPGRYIITGDRHSCEKVNSSYVELKKSREAILVENLGGVGIPQKRDAYLTLIDDNLVIAWQDQFEKI